MPHTLPPSWSEVNVPVDIGSLERWQDTHRSYTYHLQLMKYPVTRGRKICSASSRDVLCYCSVESWKWRMFMFDPMLLVSIKKRCVFHVQCQDLIINMSETWKKNCSQAQLPTNLSPFSQNQTITSFHLLQDSTCCNLGLHQLASWHGQGTQPRVKSPPLERLKWCFMLCV